MRIKVVVVFVCALLVTGVQSRPRLHTVWPGLDLTGKMFTLSENNGGVTFYPGSYSPPSSSTPSYTSSSYTPQAPTSASLPTSLPWTTATPTRGFSVCLRYMADSSGYVSILNLGTGWNTMRLSRSAIGQYMFGNNYQSIYLTPKFNFWPHLEENMWTSFCLTGDTMTNITQVFQDSRMSIRAMLPSLHRWQYEPVMEFPGFSGQVTDLQLWDYPLTYQEVYSYMSRGRYRSYHGSLLSWSNISYSNRENSLLEDEYNLLAEQPPGGRGGRGGRGGKRGRGGHPRKRKSPRKVFGQGESQQKKALVIF